MTPPSLLLLKKSRLAGILQNPLVSKIIDFESHGFPSSPGLPTFSGPTPTASLSSGVLFPPTVGKFDPRHCSSFRKKLGCALFGKLRMAYKIIDFDPLRFSFYGLPTTFSRFRAFGAPCPPGFLHPLAYQLFRGPIRPYDSQGNITSSHPSTTLWHTSPPGIRCPLLASGLGNFFFLLLSSDFCHLFSPPPGSRVPLD